MAMIAPTRGMAARFRTSDDSEMRLKLRAMMGAAPRAAVTDRQTSSVVLSGRRGSLFSRGGVKRMMVRVAA